MIKMNKRVKTVAAKLDVVEQMAELLKAAAADWEKDHIKRWGPKSKKPDPRMVVAGRADAEDLCYIAKLLLVDKHGACKRADDLDTIVREFIPSRVWNWLHSLDNDVPIERKCPHCGHVVG